MQRQKKQWIRLMALGLIHFVWEKIVGLPEPLWIFTAPEQELLKVLESKINFLLFSSNICFKYNI